MRVSSEHRRSLGAIFLACISLLPWPVRAGQLARTFTVQVVILPRCAGTDDRAWPQRISVFCTAHVPLAVSYGESRIALSEDDHDATLEAIPLAHVIRDPDSNEGLVINF